MCVCMCVHAIVACVHTYLCMYPCILHIFAVLYLVCGSCFSVVHYLVGGSTGIVVGGVFGGIVFISCIVGITLLRVCLRIAAIQRRTQNIEATQVPRPGTGRRVILLRRVCRVPATNPDAPPPYVPSADIQSSDPPPYTTNSANCPLHVSVEDTPTPQPLPPEAPPSNPFEDPPENLPPPGMDQDREPLLAEEQ